MKIAVLINENLQDMVLGANTSLSYILAAAAFGDVYVYKIDELGELKKNVKAIFFNKNNSQEIIDEYRNENKKISQTLLNQNLPPKKFVRDLKKNLEMRDFSFDDIDFVIQRLEPMKPPFPPFGKVNINEFLRDFSEKIFTKNKIYNLPIDCFGDKEFPLELDDKNVAVPTKISFLADENIAQKVRKIGQKIILKPDNSAQAFGVFAIEFDENGFDLQRILLEKLSDLIVGETFKIKPQIDDEELKKIIHILFFVQDFKVKKEISDKKIGDFNDSQIKIRGEQLYGHKILIQPFIEGVRIGDIRIILAKMSDENFAIIGSVFRKTISTNSKNFATGIMSGSSIPVDISSVLNDEEQKDLIAKTNYVISQLNTKFREQYKNCFELGLDFLLFGDKKHVFLGEANHYCQGLIPFCEAVLKNEFYDKINGVKIEHNYGLNITKTVIGEQLSLRRKVL